MESLPARATPKAILERAATRIKTARNFKLDRRSLGVRELLETLSNRLEHGRDLGILFKP